MVDILKLIRTKELMEIVPWARTKQQEKIKAGLMPPPISTGQRGVAYYETEINATLAVTIVGYNDEQIKKFVSELVARRKELLKKYTHLEAAND
ncbi:MULTISPECIES: AlpA family phage regulatory protein [unclassified Pseudoalteromonas]|jgi:prophage regulatory protein|uniref:helix-turn-helix transcriptional regulator n=1 Tax=unclassified Pseudoalteromonas TaxID=194690 RepID=UPI0007E5235C|nr:MULTISPECIES: AlpA family phage regulatory protein [unclassified Pseudoalteromonas]MDN3490553.1 AlpA family phage regulatory protein [Pseudoalteromonas sp. APC 3694]SFT89101.1 transcriptional regulator, AlpA family [Pseudoalteromonas sp. DSM 26666]